MQEILVFSAALVCVVSATAESFEWVNKSRSAPQAQ